MRRRHAILGFGAVALASCPRRRGPQDDAEARLPPIEGPIDLVAIGPYPDNLLVAPSGVHLVRGPALGRLARELEAWFEREVRISRHAAEAELERLPARERDGIRQLDAVAVLNWIETWKRPDSACTLAITIQDLFADDAAWVFGYADAEQRIGVHSLLRYDPGFPEPDRRPEGWRDIMWERARRVALHETEHLLGLGHCHAGPCLMNETSGIRDVDAAPLELCPPCRAKHDAARPLSR